MRFRCSLLAIALVTGACLPETVELEYSFEEGSTVAYRMTARADARWDVGGRGSGSYEVSFDIEETITDVDDQGATLQVEMVPTDTEEEGLPSPGLERRTFSLRVGPNGEVLEALQLDGIEASALGQDELAFIGTYRPALPREPVRLGDEWTDQRDIRFGTDIQAIESTGTLIGFARDGRQELARISFTGVGPLSWVTDLPQGEAQLTGDAETTGVALFDIGTGNLDEATSSTRGAFDVRVIPSSGLAPITGTLDLDLELTVETL